MMNKYKITGTAEKISDFTTYVTDLTERDALEKATATVSSHGYRIVPSSVTIKQVENNDAK